MTRDLRLASLSMFIWALGEGLFLNLIPLTLRDLGANAGLIGAAFAIMAMAQAVALIPAGLAADRWGERPVMIGGWLMGLTATLLMASAANLTVFVVGLAAYGLSGWMIPPLTSYVTRGRGALTPERALTSVFAGFSAGSIISPTVGGLVAERFGMPVTYWVALVIFVVSTTIITRCRSLPQDTAVNTTQVHNLLGNRRYLGLLVLCFLAMFALSLGVPLAPVFVQARWGVSLAQIGLLGSAVAAGEMTLALLLGRRSPRRALLVLLLGGAVYCGLLLTSGQMGWLALAFFLRAGANISRQFVDALATRIVPVERYGMAFAGDSFVGRLANTASSAAAGWFYLARPELPFIVALVVIGVALGAVYLLAPRPTHKEVTAAG